jgi:uncharacterized ion transporter superfamily protein YfcC
LTLSIISMEYNDESRDVFFWHPIKRKMVAPAMIVTMDRSIFLMIEASFISPP